MTSKFKSYSHLFLAVFFTQFIQIRPYLSKNFYGDPFDGRLHIVLHEHWWRFLRGETSLRDTGFFYPFDKSLGLSDPFIIQGLIHSFSRFLNFDMYESWAISIIVMLLIGNIGMALLASKLFANRIVQIFFVIISGISYTYIAHIQSHSNITGIALVPYAINFLIEYRKNFIKSISGLLVIFPVLMLTSWYAAFFLFIFMVLIILTTRNLKNRIQKFLDETKKNFKIILPYFLLSFATILLFAYIHLPVLSSSTRTTEEMVLNSPKFSNLLNGSQLGGGIFERIYKFLGYQGEKFYYEYQIGLTVSIFAITIFIAFYFLINFRKIQDLSFLVRLYCINIIILVIFFVHNNLSVFSFLYDHIKVFSSIRVPIRYLIFFSNLNLFILLKILDLKSLRYSKSKWSLITIILLTIITLDQYRFKTSEFDKASYQGDKKLTKILLTNPDCRSFILATEGMEWWDDQLQAMITSAESGVPTVNGYSGGFPKYYPNLNWRSKSDLLSVGKWLKLNNADPNTCVLRRNLVENFSTKIFVETFDGFDLMETNGEDIWRWSTSNSASLKLINYRDTAVEGTITLYLKLPKCSLETFVNVGIGSSEKLKLKIESRENISVALNYAIDKESEQYLDFFTESPGCMVEKDPRKLYFNVSNISFD
jgi:hypothetical protein